MRRCPLAPAALLALAAPVVLLASAPAARGASTPAPAPAPAADEAKQVALIREALEDGNLEEASVRGERAVAALPKSGAVHQWTGRAYAARAVAASDVSAVLWGHRAERLLTKAVELDPANVEARFDLLAALLRPEGLRGTDLAGAEDQAREIGRLDAAFGHVAQAMVLQAQGKVEPAGAEYRKAFELKPGSRRAFVGVVEFEARAGNYAAAVEAARRARTMTTDPLPSYLLGRLSVQFSRDLESGLAAFDEYLARKPLPESPSLADAHWRKGQIYQRLGKVAEAKAEYAAALKLTPGHPEASQELAKLSK